MRINANFVSVVVCKNISVIRRIAEVLRSAIAEHACGLGHRISWDGAGVIEQESDWRSRKMKEALHIFMEK